MLRTIYTVAFLLALPFIFARLWWKEKKVPGYRIRWLQRLGIFKYLKAPKPVVWVHAVSVGEVVAATGLIRQLLREGNITLMVTTMTPTGSARVTATFGADVAHVYAPFDLPWTVAAFIRRTRPILTIIMETEIWPNMLLECARKKVPMILANARLSARSAQRYGRFPSATKKFFNLLDHVAVQNETDGERFTQLGLHPHKLTVIGSVKFDITLTPALRKQAEHLKAQYSNSGARPIVIAASTHESEESILLAAFAKLKPMHPQLLMVIVPRHPERFDDVVQLASDHFKTLRRSSNSVPDASIEIVIGDTMGELMLLYGIADIAFVGGSLIERGGHNMIEPAAWGIPVVCGPHNYNFDDISKGLVAAGGMRSVCGGHELVQTLDHWLRHPAQRMLSGSQALEYTESNRGAIAKLLEIVRQYTHTPRT